MIFHKDQKLENGHKLKEHCCSKENEKLKSNILIETNIQGKSKYRKEKGKEYTDIESFQNRTTLQEIEIKENQRNRKRNTLSPIEEKRIIKMRIASRKREQKGEKCKGGEQGESRGDRNRTSSRNNPCIQ